MFTLRTSLIKDAGIGCFVESYFRRGEQLLPGYKGKFRFLALADIPEPFVKYCMLRSDGRYTCPESFLKMGVCWYINHSRTPNCEFVKGKLCAVTDLTPGVELTLYYRDLLSHPKNGGWCKAGDIDWRCHQSVLIFTTTAQTQPCV
jgi:hypothetical protein